MSKTLFLLDADVFITAKNLYYAFDICPAFWRNVLQSNRDGLVFSIDRIRGESLSGTRDEDLVRWVKGRVPGQFFCDSTVVTVREMYADIMTWLQGQPRYSDRAKAEFASGADGWLVAHARIYDMTVVTNERGARKAKAVVKLPDVCREFGVKHSSTFTMLRALGICFD